MFDHRTATQWEYQVEKHTMGWKGFRYDEVGSRVNDLGRDGWEVLSTLAPSYGQGQAIEIVVVLKRAAA